MVFCIADKNVEISCPSCDSEAVYRYGKTHSGKQRFLCMICGRQFTPGADREMVTNRPLCHVCGATMHLYKKEAGFLRFRCSGYPGCKTFKKIGLGGCE